MSDGQTDRPSDVPWRWVLLGIPVGLLAAFDGDGAGVWWVLAHGAALLWRLPYAPLVICGVATLLVAVVGYRLWKERG